jgi:hypothetical protein
MSLIDDIRVKREDLARVLKNHTGIRRIVEDLYPDNAHFIYELLQNAEDTGATEAHFTLSVDRLAFEHNGRPFHERDILGITDIGEGSKTHDNDKIGRFGVGFKAVFAYSETPYIWSSKYFFKISDLVLPTEIASKKIGKKTRFEFPFNNPKKFPEIAYREIKTGLSAISETALLFLRNIRNITWRIDGEKIHKLSRIEYTDCHIELIREINEQQVNLDGHYLLFREPAKELPQQDIAIAFQLRLLPKSAKFTPQEPLAGQFMILPSTPGRVSVFFPAEKETSGLRFHLQAPFVPELSRASVKDTPANLPLFQQIATLTAASLHRIRDLGLLTGEFLAILPNPQDAIPARYQVIREAIVHAMNEEPLTPTYSGSHAPARKLLQAKASLKDLLTAHDLEEVEYFIDSDWAIGASQSNSNLDRFLSGLAIKNWGIDKFVETLLYRMGHEDFHDSNFERWLSNKSYEWHQQLYALIYRDMAIPDPSVFNFFMIRCRNNEYAPPAWDCYFDDTNHNDFADFYFVAKEVYSSGKNKAQQEDSRKFLEKIGVRTVNEKDKILAELRKFRSDQRVNKNNTDLQLSCFHSFISFLSTNSKESEIFRHFEIFKCQDGIWRTGNEIFLDTPFIDTGLHRYHQVFKHGKRWALTDSYLKDEEFKKPGFREKFIDFARRIGAQDRLVIKETSCRDNPQLNKLIGQARGGWSDQYGVDRDYTIDGLREIVRSKDEAISRLIWKTVCEAHSTEWMTAKFRNNSQQPYNYESSQLFVILRDCHWVPQKDGTFLPPYKARRELLPEGFPFDEGYKWIKEIRFGSKADSSAGSPTTTTKEKNLGLARDLGLSIKSTDDLERAQAFSKIPPEEQARLLEEHRSRTSTGDEFPDHSIRNKELRVQRIREEVAQTPLKQSEVRQRSVSVGYEDTKSSAKLYLREQYTNSNGVMCCQVCQSALPFRLPTGEYYFEAVEAISGSSRRLRETFLALCPNHAAMFQYANDQRERIQELLETAVGQEIELTLGGQATTMRFTETHIADIQTCLAHQSLEE